MKFILASGSPRRSELLKMLGLNFVVAPSCSPEKTDFRASPEETVMSLASAKAAEPGVMPDKDDIVIAADTLVYLDGQPMGKPADREEAKLMLHRLSGRCHTVYTGIAIMKNNDMTTKSVSTRVFFRELTDDEITEYVNTGEPMDKAGAYGAQGLGALLVEKIEGDFFNVMGLPVCTLGRMLSDIGYDILSHEFR